MKPGLIVAFLTVSVLVLGAGGCGRVEPEPSVATFNKDIAPIVFANCSPCHRPGEAAPFSLLSYADAVKHGRTIAAVTLKRYMPPWLPEHGEFQILNERRLSEEQIGAIQRWVNSGMPEGNAADLPAPPAWPDGWQFGQPDLVLTLEQPYLLVPGDKDTYRDLVLRTPLTSDVFVRAVEFRTGGAPIHHAVIRMDRTSASRRRDGQDGQPGLDGMAWQSDVQNPEGQFIGWAPGRGPIVSPDGMPWRLYRGADLVVEVHIPSSGRPLSIQPTIGLFLTDTPPVKVPVRVTMGSKVIDIPAGQPDYVVTDTYELPAPVDLLSVFPHAHYLGKEMLITAALPDGGVKSLLHIRQWNFQWQQDYRYATPVSLPRGTRLTMRYTYDNSDGNVRNPNRPPVRVKAGLRSIDEMATFGLQVMPQSPEDGARILETFAERDLLANVAMGEALVRDAPDVAENQAVLGAAYVEAGRAADAIPHLEEALRLKDRSAGTYNYLGLALMAQGRLPEAVTHFKQAADIAPRDEAMYFNLGNALNALSRYSEATTAYERSLTINPDFPDAHVNLGILLNSRGRTEDALTHFKRAADLRPDSAIIQINAGNALAGAGRYTEAIQYVRRTLQLDPDFGPALDTLKRLQQLGIR